MATYQDIMPADIFSIRAYNERLHKKYTQEKIFLTVYTITMICLGLWWSMWMVHTDDTNAHHIPAEYINSYVFMYTAIFVVFMMIPGYLSSQILLSVIDPFKYEQAEQQYLTAWTSSIQPQMIHSVRTFQRLSTVLPDNAANDPAYATMFQLCESIKADITKPPALRNIDCDGTKIIDFNTTPEFMTLNGMMEAYRAQHPIT